ncbi:MAG: hypothetical protein ACXWK7_18830 [Caulobacteraceae bacterium]
MHKTLALTSVAAVLAFGGSALAQAPAAKAPAAATTASKPAATTTTTTTAPAGASAAATTTTTTAAPPASAAAPATTTTTTAQAAPPATSATPATGADASANAGASATVMSGMSVKDNTGALIGEVKAVKGAVATIAMGSDTFNVDTDKLGVKDGVASINASQAELKKMLPAKK